MESSSLFPIIFGLAFAVFIIVSMWKVFEKAGQPGWACIVPIYGAYVLTQIAKKPGWWVILMLIPYVNIIALFVIYIALAKQFGKGAGFGIGLVFLSPIFMAILGFGDAEYTGDSQEELISEFGEEE